MDGQSLQTSIYVQLTRRQAGLDDAVLELNDRPDAGAELDVDGGHEA